MKEFLKGLAISLWTKHRKKAIAAILALIFAGVAAITGIPLSEIQDAAKEAASKPAVIEDIKPEVPAVVAPTGEVK